MKSPNLKTIALGTAIVAVFMFSGLALAQGPGGGPGKGMGRGAGACCDQDGPGRGLERLAARLELNEEQTKAVADLHAKQRERNLALRTDLMRLRHELEGEMLKDQPDAKAVKSLAGKIGELRTAMQQNRLETRLAVRQQLTPEQRDRMRFVSFEVAFNGDNSNHTVRHDHGTWSCTCNFFQTRGVC
ncbi:MAG: Spy/CpxP family protein refolding chaperone, partial [Krumholzibacteria bacterium]|nr:Spy/CpxP family protein refolding chaperone [Candidatus Krumholzibacteria bacterium]